MKNMTKLGLIFGLLCVAVHSASAADCINPAPAILATTPTNDFVINDDDTAIHRKTGLMWMRCPLGYELSSSSEGGTCELVGMNEFDWQEALQVAEATDYSHYSDWRLPNRNELESIVELACSEPSINSGLFPSPNPALTPPHDAAFWSSSPVHAVSNADTAWAVSFTDGTVQEHVKSSGYLVRLVRDLPSE